MGQFVLAIGADDGKVVDVFGGFITTVAVAVGLDSQVVEFPWVPLNPIIPPLKSKFDEL